MARPLTTHPIRKLHLFPAPVAFFIVIAALFSVFSVVALLCGSHGKMMKRLKRGGKEKLAEVKKLKRSLTVNPLLKGKMIYGKKVQHGGRGEELEEDECLWKKTIIRGEKCRDLNFSGRILYDSDGNILPE